MGDVSSSKTPKGKVLIVDDALDTVEIIQTLLRYEGHEVLTPYSGEEGVTRVIMEKPDVVLLDINLPGFDGNEALRRIRKINPLISVIMRSRPTPRWIMRFRLSGTGLRTSSRSLSKTSI